MSSEIKAYNKFVEDAKAEDIEVLVEPSEYKGNLIIKFSPKQISAFSDFKNEIMSTFKGIKDIQIPDKIVIENFKVKRPVIKFYGDESNCIKKLKFTLTQEIKEKIDKLFKNILQKDYTKKELKHKRKLVYQYDIDIDYLNTSEIKLCSGYGIGIYNILYNLNHFPKSASLQIIYKGITDEIIYNLIDYDKLYYKCNYSEICSMFNKYIVDDFIKGLYHDFSIKTNLKPLLINKIPHPIY